MCIYDYLCFFCLNAMSYPTAAQGTRMHNILCLLLSGRNHQRFQTNASNSSMNKEQQTPGNLKATDYTPPHKKNKNKKQHTSPAHSGLSPPRKKKKNTIPAHTSNPPSAPRSGPCPRHQGFQEHLARQIPHLADPLAPRLVGPPGRTGPGSGSGSGWGSDGREAGMTHV